MRLKRKDNSTIIEMNVECKTHLILICSQENISLRGANLRGADLRNIDLRGIDLRLANLTEADLRKSDLRGTDLRGADLRGADLKGADLKGADLKGSNLKEADLYSSNLSNADLRGANLRGANLDFSAIPLYCGGLEIKMDRKQIIQLLFHSASNMQDYLKNNEDKELLEIYNKIKKIQNDFHKITEVNKLEEV